MLKITLAFALALGAASANGAHEAQRRPFHFTYQDVAYAGEVVIPRTNAKGVIIIIPGHGRTNFVGGNQFRDTREFFVEQAYSVAYWDKAGCGASEGEYDHHQSILSSAQEAVAAITAIDELDLPNSAHLGVWGISRAGWIVPELSQLYGDIKFWISVSGTTELDNGRYMLEANLRAEGRSEEQIALLMSEWDDYQRILVRGGSLEEFNAKTEHLIADPYFNANGFEMTEEGLINIQSFYQSGAFTFDEHTNLAVMDANLEETLSGLSIPVMAVLGRLDTQVDWKATGELYARASKKGSMQLTTVYLDNCNHIMRESVTGAIHEPLGPDAPACDGYFDAMAAWLDSLTAAQTKR